MRWRTLLAAAVALAAVTPAGATEPTTPPTRIDLDVAAERLTLERVSYAFASLPASLPSAFTLSAGASVSEVFAHASRDAVDRNYDLGPATLPAGDVAVGAQIVDLVADPRRQITSVFSVRFDGPGGLTYGATSPPFEILEGTNIYVFSMPIMTGSAQYGGDVQITVRRGYLNLRITDTFFQSQGSIDPQIPADFFEPGSDPFTGTVQLRGEPLSDPAPFDLAPTDTVIERIAPPLPPGPFGDTVPIEIVALNLVSVEPITVTVRGCCPDLWNVRVTLPHGPVLPGSMTVTKTHANGGTFTAEFLVQPRFTFRRQSDGLERVFDAPHETLNGSGEWTPPPCQALPGFKGAEDLCVGQIVLHSERTHLVLEPTPVPDGPAPQIDPSAHVDPAALLATGVVVGANTFVGAGALIGPGSVIGANAGIGDGAIVGAGAVISDGAWVGALGVVGGRSLLEPWAFVDQEAVLGEESLIDTFSWLGPGARIGSHAVIGSFSTVGAGVRAGSELVMGDRSLIEEDLIAAEGTQIVSGGIVIASTYPCDLYGTRFPSEASSCSLAGGVVEGCTTIPASDRVPPPPGQQITPGTVTGTAHTQLEGDVDGTGVAPGNGGQPYVPTTHDCDDFADELEQGLTARGYDATFTVYWRLNPDWRWYNRLWTDRWIDGHAITDIRQADGTTVWIEPQLSAAQGAVGQDLDFDDDGRVGVDTTSGDDTTEDGYRIEVYGSRAEAEAAGNVLD